MSNYYDVIIVGAGISGLYSAYNIKKLNPNKSICILESNRRQYIGGRIGNDVFYGSTIVRGAGVGRQSTDKLLQKLLHELHIDFHPKIVNMNYSKLIKNPMNIQKMLLELREEYEKYKIKPSITFKKFVKPYLGDTLYKKFIVSSGYSDYENEDVFEVLYHYQMDDNGPGWTSLSIPWKKLIEALVAKIGATNIKTTKKVTIIEKIENKPCLFLVETEKGEQFISNKVIVATRINSTQKLVVNGSKHNSIYQSVHGQPFLYVYAKFTQKSADILKTFVPFYTIVPGPLQKMVPMNPEKGVYMIAYCDNKNADYLKDFVSNVPQNRTFFEKEVENALGIESGSLKIIAIKDYYWPIGTHYFDPLDKTKFTSRNDFLNKAQHPENGMLVVGEAFSIRQGWTEGALSSVQAVLNKQWLDNKNC